MNHSDSAQGKICLSLTNKPGSSLGLGFNNIHVKLKHKNVFVNKFVSIRIDVTISNIISLYVYMYKNILDVGLITHPHTSHNQSIKAWQFYNNPAPPV